MIMKRCFLILPLLVFACAKNPAPVAFPVPSGDCVAVSVSGLTKGAAPLVSLEELSRQGFSVSAWYNPEGETFDVPGGTAIKYVGNQRFKYVAPLWVGNKPLYWPLDGTLTFFCFAPFTESVVLEDPVTDAGIAARLPGYLVGSPLLKVTPATEAGSQVDFLCAPPVLDKSRKEMAGSVELDFSAHRMTQVQFSFNETGFVYPTGTVPEGDPVAVRVTSITIRNVIGAQYLYFTENIPYVTGQGTADHRPVQCALCERTGAQRRQRQPPGRANRYGPAVPSAPDASCGSRTGGAVFAGGTARTACDHGNRNSPASAFFRICLAGRQGRTLLDYAGYSGAGCLRHYSPGL